jgi:hypothetical protein
MRIGAFGFEGVQQAAIDPLILVHSFVMPTR